MFAGVGKIERRFVLGAALSAIGVVAVLAFAPLPAGAASRGHHNEEAYKAYLAECEKMNPQSQAYRNCIAMAQQM
jgi:hypothetical protein